MQSGLRKALAATSLSLALATTGAVFVTFSTADMAVAGNHKANGGNGGNRGGNSDRGAERGNSGKSNGAGAQNVNRGGGNSANAGGKGLAETLGLGGGAGAGGGGNKLFGLLPRHQPSGSANKGAEQSAGRSAPQTSARPAPKSAPEDDLAQYGNSWKSRVEGGMLETHPRELGMWNSARRSPQAIANMVAKYEETGEVNGAGGMIGFFVSSYSTYNEAKGSYFDALQAAVDNGDMTAEVAERLFSGDLTRDSFEDDLEGFEGDIVLGDDGMVSCADGADCALGDIQRLQADADALATIESDPELQQLAEDFDAASESRMEADAIVQPNFTPDDPAVQEQMLADVKDLLDVDEYETPTFVDPEPEIEGDGQVSTESLQDDA
jgi:hypothetical protein